MTNQALEYFKMINELEPTCQKMKKSKTANERYELAKSKKQKECDRRKLRQIYKCEVDEEIDDNIGGLNDRA